MLFEDQSRLALCAVLHHNLQEHYLLVKWVRQVSVECLGLKPDWFLYKSLLSLRNFSVCKWTTFSKILEKRGSNEIGL